LNNPSGEAGKNALLQAYQRRIDIYNKTKYAFLSVITLTDEKCQSEEKLNTKKQNTTLFQFRQGIKGKGNLLSNDMIRAIFGYIKPRSFEILT